MVLLSECKQQVIRDQKRLQCRRPMGEIYQTSCHFSAMLGEQFRLDEFLDAVVDVVLVFEESIVTALQEMNEHLEFLEYCRMVASLSILIVLERCGHSKRRRKDALDLGVEVCLGCDVSVRCRGESKGGHCPMKRGNVGAGRANEIISGV